MPEDFGADDYGEDVYSGELSRLITTEFIEYFPNILPRELSSVFRRYVDSHGIEYDGLDAGMSYTKLSHSVRDAEGKDLDRIGSLFGELGGRGTRNDAEYRQYLQSLVQSFNGRGTEPGLKFAIAAAVDTDESNIVIDEDVDNNEYTIEINDPDTSFLSGTVNTLAELADPSGVALSEEPVIVTIGDNAIFQSSESSVVATSDGLGAGTLTIDGNSQLT
jgi:hypothetical protein